MVLGEFFFICGGILVWDSFKQLFAEVADSNAPKIHVRVRRQKVPWLTREVKKINERRRLLSQTFTELRLTMNLIGVPSSAYVML